LECRWLKLVIQNRPVLVTTVSNTAELQHCSLSLFLQRPS
jgi:hypothetical protein